MLAIWERGKDGKPDRLFAKGRAGEMDKLFKKAKLAYPHKKLFLGDIDPQNKEKPVGWYDKRKRIKME